MKPKKPFSTENAKSTEKREEGKKIPRQPEAAGFNLDWPLFTEETGQLRQNHANFPRLVFRAVRPRGTSSQSVTQKKVRCASMWLPWIIIHGKPPVVRLHKDAFSSRDSTEDGSSSLPRAALLAATIPEVKIGTEASNAAEQVCYSRKHRPTKENRIERAAARALLFVLSCLALAGAPVAAKGQGTSSEQSRHGREFWRAIAKNHYVIPAGQEAFPLARELSGYLGSPDPELRDDLAYSMLAVWITRQKKFSTEELVTLLEQWQSNLRVGIGETGTDSIFRRSFSALCLSSLAERDLRDPFLGESRFRALLNRALTYLGDERDLRGFDAEKGWIHATAHTADLLAALAENKLFTRQDQERVLKAITQRLATANVIFSYGEQDRLANVAAAIASREEFDSLGWSSWVAQMDKDDRVVWNDSPPKMPALARFQNDSYFLSATAAQLSLRPATSTSAEAQKSVLAVLRHR